MVTPFIMKLSYIRRRYGSINNYISNYLTEENYQNLKRKNPRLKLYRERLRFIEKTLQKIYPDKWDIQLDCSDENINILIWFPEFNITNYKNESHNIKDLYVKLVFNYDLTLIDSCFQGARTTVNYIEHTNSYWHSHLPMVFIPYNSFYFRPFCTGYTILKQTLILLKSDFVESSFESLLYQIQDYIIWESMGGVPYIKINSFTKKSKLKDYSPSDIHEKIMLDEFLKASSFNLSIQQEPLTNIEVIKDDYFEEEVTKIVKEYLPQYLVYKGENGQYSSESYINAFTIKDPVLKFKNKNIYYKIIKTDEIIKQYAHPKITDWIAKTISKKITESQFKESRTN